MGQEEERMSNAPRRCSVFGPPLRKQGCFVEGCRPHPPVSSHSIPSLPGWHSPFWLGSLRGRAREVV